MKNQHEITNILQNEDLSNSNKQEKLFNLVYANLKDIAKRLLVNERNNHTFGASDLVNEGFFKLQNLQKIQWANRSHFYKISVRAMKQVLIDHARSRGADKRGANANKVSLTLASRIASSEKAIDDLISLHDALQAYAKYDPEGRGNKIIEYAYFQGMTHQEIADVMGVATKTIQRDRRLAEAWLKRYFATNTNSSFSFQE